LLVAASQLPGDGESQLTTLIGPDVVDETRPLVHRGPDVAYFRGLLKTEAARLTTMCTSWRETLNDHSDLSEDSELLSID